MSVKTRLQKLEQHSSGENCPHAPYVVVRGIGNDAPTDHAIQNATFQCPCGKPSIAIVVRREERSIKGG